MVHTMSLHNYCVRFTSSILLVLLFQVSWTENHDTAATGKRTINFYDEEGASAIRKVQVMTQTRTVHGQDTHTHTHTRFAIRILNFDYKLELRCNDLDYTTQYVVAAGQH